MPRYHFHATDGYSAVFDRVGQRLDATDMEIAAAEAAEGARQRFGLLADLRDWLIVVTDDESFQIAVYGFGELSEVVRFEAMAA